MNRCFPLCIALIVSTLALGAGEPQSSTTTSTVVVLPDTQHYAASYPTTFHAQTQWIVDNRERLNIVGVTGLGDIVNSDSSESQWIVADAAYRRLDGVVRYAPAWGNHDSIYSSSSFHWKYFTSARFQNQPGFCGAGIVDGTKPRTFGVCQQLQNNWVVIATGWLHASMDGETTLEDEPDDENVSSLSRSKRIARFIRDKAREVAPRPVIVVLHQNLREDGTRATGYDWVFNNVIAPEPNIRIVLNGHELGQQVEAYRATLANGRVVHEMLSNYQSRTRGGDGWLRTLTFDSVTKKVAVRTFSPTLNQFETDANSHFDINLDSMETTPAPAPATSTRPAAPTSLRIIGGGE